MGPGKSTIVPFMVQGPSDVRVHIDPVERRDHLQDDSDKCLAFINYDCEFEERSHGDRFSVPIGPEKDLTSFPPIEGLGPARPTSPLLLPLIPTSTTSRSQADPPVVSVL